VFVRGAGTLGPVPLSEGGSSIALDDNNESKSSRLGRSLPVLIATHETHDKLPQWSCG